MSKRCQFRACQWLILLLGGLLSVACGQVLPQRGQPVRTQTEPLRILAAASLLEPFTALGHLWEEQVPETPLEFNFASSHYLVLQLMQGAPGDLLATADRAQIDRVLAADLAQIQNVTPLARNALALAVHPRATFPITGLRDLAQPGVRLAWARPGVPLATYTDRLLALPDWDLSETVRNRIAENILTFDANARGVRNRLLAGEVDAAILYVSDALAVADRLDIVWLEPGRNVEVVLYMAPLRTSTRVRTSRKFMELVLSEQGQMVMRRFGFEAYGSE